MLNRVFQLPYDTEEHKETKTLGAGLVLKLSSSNFWSSAVSLTLILTENKEEKLHQGLSIDHLLCRLSEE